MTTGLIIVSHSKRLALGVIELAHALAGDDVAMVAVGGGDEQVSDSFGVNASMVLEAIAELSNVDEIGMIGDVGSSFLATGAAIELEGLGERVRMIDCPMVEGAIACAMTLSMGGSLDEAIEAGQHAWKVRKLGA
jgi:PTS hybrid protein